MHNLRRQEWLCDLCWNDGMKLSARDGFDGWSIPERNIQKLIKQEGLFTKLPSMALEVTGSGSDDDDDIDIYGM